MIKPLFTHQTLCNICYEIAMNFIILIFHTKNKKFIAKNTTKVIPKTNRYHTEGSKHPKQLPKITPPNPILYTKSQVFHKNEILIL